MEDSVRKVEFFYFVEILELHLEKRLLIDAQIFDPPTAQTVCCPRSEWKFWTRRRRLFIIHMGFCQGSKHDGGGERLGCPASDVNPRHLDETPPNTQVSWRRILTLTTFCL